MEAITAMTAETTNDLSFEKVWELFQETAKRFQELERNMAKENSYVREMFQELERNTAKENNYVREMFQDTAKRFQETDKYVKRLSKNIGGLNDSMGALIETLIAARLWEQFDAYPYNLKRAYRRVPIYDHTSTVITDIDILLSNGEYAMAVEVKREINKQEDVDHHERRMNRIVSYPPDEIKGKTLLGALAGGSVEPDTMAYAYHKGFFVLELSGKTVSLIDPPDGFAPTTWRT
jgi:hypothetical protein